MCYLALGVIGVCITPGRNGFGYGGDITHCSNSYCLIILDVPLSVFRTVLLHRWQEYRLQSEIYPCVVVFCTASLTEQPYSDFVSPGKQFTRDLALDLGRVFLCHYAPLLC